MNKWLAQQGTALRAACFQLKKAPGSFLMNVLVITIALTLPVAGWTILENVRPLSQQLAVDPEISIFLRTDLSREQAEALATPIQQIVHAQDIPSRLTFIPREQALNSLKEKTGLAEAIATLGNNPLPDAYILKLSGFTDSAQLGNRLNTLQTQLQALPGIEFVQVDSAWTKRLTALLHILYVGLLCLGGALLTVVITVIFNTIRLQIMTQRAEINISRLFGATDGFICRPFYYAGALLGICAGALALGIVALLLRPVNVAIAEFAGLYATEFHLMPLGQVMSGLFLVSCALPGLISTALCVKRYLGRIN